MAQFFAIMPVKGVKLKSAKDLCFTWKSYRTIYSSIVFALICLNAVCAAFWLLNEHITFIRIGKLLRSCYAAGIQNLCLWTHSILVFITFNRVLRRSHGIKDK